MGLFDVNILYDKINSQEFFNFYDNNIKPNLNSLDIYKKICLVLLFSCYLVTGIIFHKCIKDIINADFSYLVFIIVLIISFAVLIFAIIIIYIAFQQLYTKEISSFLPEMLFPYLPESEILKPTQEEINKDFKLSKDFGFIKDNHYKISSLYFKHSFILNNTKITTQKLEIIKSFYRNNIGLYGFLGTRTKHYIKKVSGILITLPFDCNYKELLVKRRSGKLEVKGRHNSVDFIFYNNFEISFSDKEFKDKILTIELMSKLNNLCKYYKDISIKITDNTLYIFIDSDIYDIKFSLFKSMYNADLYRKKLCDYVKFLSVIESFDFIKV